ncbi:MAG TPA: dethiobiotin synthase [Leeuwenhoekiella sp.]|nr:dethiobiotin synthase [Leeuwenhoekiella sp.]
MQKQTFFITGISTEVGKTVASAIITEALEADYWKPIQAGDLDHTDTDKVKALVSNATTQFHPSAFELKTPMSPHAAAEIDGVKIASTEMQIPNTNNNLVIEGAGGLLVPISETETILDLIKPEYKVIVISRHYLGSINHTLLTIDKLKQSGKSIFGILFSGAENPSTEQIIATMSGVKILGRIDEEPYFDQMVVKEYAEVFREQL